MKKDIYLLGDMSILIISIYSLHLNKFYREIIMTRINTSKMLNNDGYYNGGIEAEVINTTNITVSPLVSDQYDYSVTEDVELLQERKRTSEELYKIYIESPFAKEYIDEETNLIKIPKEDIKKVFYYMKEKLLKVKTISAYETVIAINEFFDFNYDFVVKKVLSSKMMAEILEDYYTNMGMADRINDVAADPLF